MLISHKYKFIFIKTRKTAGTSIEVELSRVMGDDGIWVPAEYMNTLGIFSIERFRIVKLRTWLRPPPENKISSHVAARRLKKHIGAGIFDRYFKFCVEREPVDKCISMYWFLKRNPNYIEKFRSLDMSWERFLDNKKRWPIDTHLWTDEAGRPMVDRILRYENLDEEIRQVGRELGFRIEGVKERYKTDLRRPGIKVSEGQRKRIYQPFAESNRHTGYRL